MKKIMFNDKYGLTQAVLEGRKTMTRRTVPDNTMKDALAYQSNHIDEEKAGEKYIIDHAPYKVGEIVAIAQAYKVLDYTFHGFATNPSRSCGIKKECAEKQNGWGNKMFVEAKFMPHHIKITDIKVERLQDISSKDCMKEGVKEVEPYYVFPDFKKVPLCISANHYLFPTARKAFAALIDKVSGNGTWERNPWVFAYSFELVD